MKKIWPQRAYLGLFAGAGRARIEESGEIVETSAASVFRLPDPFTHHVFVDQDPLCTEALRKRLNAISTDLRFEILTGDVNALVPDILSALPSFSRERGLLSYCFVDPFAANLKFHTIRALGRFRMDFLILLMLGLDARLNFRNYLERESDSRIADLIDVPNWRAEWKREASGRRPNVIRFIIRKFDEAMVRIGYRSTPLERTHPVKVHSKGVMIYHLVFYSKDELGQTFWEETRKGVSPQLGLEL